MPKDWRDSVRNPKCRLCPLYEEAEYVCLMGSGPKKAKVLIVGEAPGEREDETHQAFIGSSGKLLDKALHDWAQLERDDVYVTNAAKCRPPQNATPKRGELKMCVNAYLDREIEHADPDYVLLLGNAALVGVTKKSGITKHSGTPWELVLGGRSRTVFATLHPAAVLRNPKNAEAWLRDIEMFGKLARGEQIGDATKVKMITKPSHFKWLLHKLEEAEVISWDIETYTEPGEPPMVHKNFQEYRDGKSHIVSVAFSWEVGAGAFLPLYHPQSPWRKLEQEMLDRLEGVMNDRTKRYVGHNGKFDARWLNYRGIPVPQTFDTMLAAHMLEENRAKGLKPLSREILRQPGYDVGEELKNATKIPLKALAVYNCKDTDYTLRLYYIFRKELVKPENQSSAKIFKKLMMPASEALVEVELNGMYVDPKRWKERHDKAQDNVEKLYEFINRDVPANLKPINLNSPPQVGRYLYGHLGLPIIEETDSGNPSTREGVLLQLLQDEPIKEIKALMKYRKWAKYLSTYILPWKFEHMDAQGKIHSTYKLYGTVTGRISSVGGVQQIPRDPFIRTIIGARPGWLFMAADYSQVELRIAAMIAGEERLLRQYINGEDVHMKRAMKMTKKLEEDVEKEERKKAKAVNFGYLYGMGAAKFVSYAFENYEVRVSQGEAERDREGFFEDYPALRQWHERQRRLARRYGFVRSPIGRIRHLPDIRSQTESVRGEAERQAINSPVQSMASDMMLMSLVEIQKQASPKEVAIVGTVHDSILFEVKEGYENKWARIVKDTMEDVERVKREFGCEITVPIVADIEIGTHWGEGKEWKAK